MGLDNPLHILFVLVVVLLIFGAKRLPEIGRSLGDGMRGFKDSLSGAPLHAGGLDQSVSPAAIATPSMPAAPHAEATRLADAAR
ncbi:MAG TPA: twin-arginine translocase TatA/TatE family subunit [Solirubrobacteraceae bacterium]|nr:twin-arginine translocase TatA/TatE family subunit [Solirubrobacteraceae bacterium]